jgi:exosortase A
MLNAAASVKQHIGQSAKREWSRACVLFLTLAAVSAILYRDAWSTMAEIWLGSSAYHQGALAAPISLFVILARRDWRDVAPRIDLFGLVPLAASFALYLVSVAFEANIIGHAAIVAALIGAAILTFGRNVARRWSFALFYLAFMIPFGEALTPTLQQWTSHAAKALLNLAGIETTLDGVILTTTAGRFEVAPSCAGLRFLIASMMISALVGYFAFESWRKRAQFFLLAIMAALVANWLRTFLIVAVVTLSERRLGLGPEHVTAGWVFYGALILALVALARRLADEPAPVAARAAPFDRT